MTLVFISYTHTHTHTSIGAKPTIDYCIATNVFPYIVHQYIFSPYQQFCSFALWSLGLLGCNRVMGVWRQCFSLNLKGHVAKEEYP